jgi:hypothetical protein
VQAKSGLTLSANATPYAADEFKLGGASFLQEQSSRPLRPLDLKQRETGAWFGAKVQLVLQLEDVVASD